MKTNQAFNNNPALKSALVEETELHRKRDQIVKGTYGKCEGTKFKGCSIGCSIHSYNLRFDKKMSVSSHEVFETEFQIPVVLAIINDWIFERLPDELAQTWPRRFFESIPVGADLRFIHGHFFAWTLIDSKFGFWKVWEAKEDQQVFVDLGNFVEYLAADLSYDKNQWDSIRNPFLDSLARLARLDSLDRLGRLGRLTSLASLAISASDKLLTLMSESKNPK